MKLSILFLLTLVFCLANCGETIDPLPTTECDTASITYTNTVAAIFSASCSTSTACHASGTNSTFPLADYDDSFLAVGFGRMMGSLNQETGFSAMPRGGAKLDQCDIDKIGAWINAGAPE